MTQHRTDLAAGTHPRARMPCSAATSNIDQATVIHLDHNPRAQADRQIEEESAISLRLVQRGTAISLPLIAAGSAISLPLIEGGSAINLPLITTHKAQMLPCVVNPKSISPSA